MKFSSYIGFDKREQAAVDVAVKTLDRMTLGQITPEFLDADKLSAHGLLGRITDHRGSDYDLISNAPKSTAFAASRFMTPLLCQGGWALYVDCDVVFLRDPREMLKDVSAAFAVHVVQHQHEPVAQWKMVNQRQTAYRRKNWSSVMLFNCDHLANRRLTLWDINHRPGRDLHAFYWLHDSEIGALDPCWNWLVDVEPRPDNLGIAHLTLGGDWLEGWKGGSFDAEWRAARDA